jgi:magnesium-transporting ATPase (P-type)
MIKVCKDEEFPCDIVLMKSDKDSGIVFVDTMNLDGEVIHIIYLLI